MIPELGNICLMFTLSLAILQAGLPWLDKFGGKGQILLIARRCAIIQFLLLGFAFICLIIAFITNDFTVNYVAMNSSQSLPVLYRIGAAWGGHEGSLLLWLFMINAWVFTLCLVSGRYPALMLGQLLSVLGMINVGFLLFMIVTSNPFTRNFINTPLTGNDLNPLLQDPGLMLHPPMLYMGYVGFALVFAFAVQGLISKKVDKNWARLAKPWIILSWASLTFGILLGSWWAYHVLGWGGWWFWDPVENASLLPWLTGTALLHAVVTVEKRGVLKGWTILLAILTFALSLLGTFLVRSGILISVHAFASDPSRGEFLLNYLCVVVILSLILFAFRAPQLPQENHFNLISRETFILSGNVILMVMMATILLGIIYPLLLDILKLGKISVGAPYFNSVFIPLSVPLFLLMGIAPLSFWQTMPLSFLIKRLRLSFTVAIILALLLPWLLVGHINARIVLGLGLSFWILATTCQIFFYKLKQVKRLTLIPIQSYGMMIAHLGIAVCIIGVTVVSLYSVEREVRIAVNESIIVGPYHFYFVGTHTERGPNYQSLHAEFEVKKQDKPVTNLVGEKRIYDVQRTPLSQVAINPGFLRDLYLALGEEISPQVWSVRIYYKPFVRWIWLGGLLMIIGGLIALIKARGNKKDVSS